MVSVEVVEARSRMNPRSTGSMARLPPASMGFRRQLFHFRAASAGACNHAFRMGLPVAYLTFRERLKEWFAEKHDACVVVHNHAGRPVIGESPIELESKQPEEFHRAWQIADRQVNEETSHRCLTGPP